MRKIFVTGGAGFIGSAFIRLVLDETDDIKIINYDALTYAGNLENLEGLDSSRHDIRQRRHLRQGHSFKCFAGRRRRGF